MEGAISVHQLNERAKSVIGQEPSLNDIWVTGEISNLKKYGSGHYYFTLKDSRSEIRAAMFKNSRARIDFEPEDNMKVTAFGSIDIYVERGSYQFIVEAMRKSGIGDLYLEYEKLKRRLETEGLFDQARKRPLPRFPKTIGVVTSPSGAVIHDIITTTARRFPVDILLYPAQVQGEGSGDSIAKGIRLLNQMDVDVLIVGRGGGSMEDLWSFNEEKVARAIYESKVPIISAVGHETDVTIADFVADVRAPTPTAAAEMAVRDRGELAKSLDLSSHRLQRAIARQLDIMRHRYERCDSKISLKRAEERVAMSLMRVDDVTFRVRSILGRGIGSIKGRYDLIEQRMSPYLRTAMNGRENELLRFTERLEGLSPNKVLERGYSFIADGDGRPIVSISALSIGSIVDVRMRDGRARANITRVIKEGTNYE